MVAVDHSHGVSFSFLCTLSQMDHVLMELKKDNIMEETLEADLPLRHGVETGLLSPNSVVWSREAPRFLY